MFSPRLLPQELQRYDPRDIMLQPLVLANMARPAPPGCPKVPYSVLDPRNTFRCVTGSAARPTAVNGSYR